MKWLPARPTVYSGIRMRSRLEADFARWLDSPDCHIRLGGEWDYEPECFADQTGQYLPDFRVVTEAGATQFIEVKSMGWFDALENDLGGIDRVLDRMEIIWSSKPEALLILSLWEYQEAGAFLAWFGWPGKGWSIMFEGEAIPWNKGVDQQ